MCILCEMRRKAKGSGDTSYEARMQLQFESLVAQTLNNIDPVAVRKSALEYRDKHQLPLTDSSTESFYTTAVHAGVTSTVQVMQRTVNDLAAFKEQTLAHMPRIRELAAGNTALMAELQPLIDMAREIATAEVKETKEMVITRAEMTGIRKQLTTGEESADVLIDEELLMIADRVEKVRPDVFVKEMSALLAKGRGQRTARMELARALISITAKTYNIVSRVGARYVAGEPNEFHSLMQSLVG